MKFLEKDLEQIIFEANNDQLMERGLPICGKKFRQLRIGNFGIADLVTVRTEFHPCELFPSHEVYVTIYELKKENINVSVFLQALSYAKGIITYVEGKYKLTPNISIVLVGKNIDAQSSFVYLPDFLDFETFNLQNFTYDYGFDGITFKNHNNYNLKLTGF